MSEHNGEQNFKPQIYTADELPDFPGDVPDNPDMILDAEVEEVGAVEYTEVASFTPIPGVPEQKTLVTNAAVVDVEDAPVTEDVGIVARVLHSAKAWIAFLVTLLGAAVLLLTDANVDASWLTVTALPILTGIATYLQKNGNTISTLGKAIVAVVVRPKELPPVLDLDGGK